MYCARLLLCVGLSILAVGCGGGDNGGRHRLAGTATFGGEPIAYGAVEFKPASGPMGSAVIRDGEFDTELEGEGVISGEHQILVTGYTEEPVVSDDETEDVEEVPPLFVHYELNGDLSGDSFHIVVPKDAEGFGVREE